MRRPGACLAAVVLLLVGRVGPADADVSFIPLPAFDTSPNEGNTYGVLPVFLFLDEQGEVRRILAPSVTHNRILGVDTAFRYFLLPPGGEWTELVADASTRGGRDVHLFYEGPRLGPDGRYYLAGRAGFERDPTARFFGIGPKTPSEDETNFTRRDVSAFLTGGLNVGRSWRLTLTERLRRVDIRPGGVKGLPSTAERFPDLPGINGAFVHAQRLDLTFDARDNPSLTTEGAFLDLGTELSSRTLGSDANFRRTVVDGRLFLQLPGLGDRLVTALRAAFESVSGRQVPFSEQATLGGEDTLRGFGDNRFTDANRIVVNVEERIKLFTLHLFGTTSELELAPFGEVGKVFRRARDFDFAELAWSTGFGFRVLVRPSVAGRVDIGVGPEGVAAFVGLGFPF